MSYKAPVTTIRLPINLVIGQQAIVNNELWYVVDYMHNPDLPLNAHAVLIKPVVEKCRDSMGLFYYKHYPNTEGYTYPLHELILIQPGTGTAYKLNLAANENAQQLNNPRRNYI